MKLMTRALRAIKRGKDVRDACRRLEEAGNIGTPTVTLIDNVKMIDGVSKTFKKFKFSNLKGENYVHPNHSGDVTSVGDGAQTIAK